MSSISLPSEIMNIPSTYDASKVEDKWYAHWLAKDYFHSEVDEREPYTIVIPPPNVTGVLHMGHMLNNTIQDVLIRRARLQGKNACWVPGTDHASIATEAKVVAMLKDKGIKKSEINREQFLEYAFQWKDKYGGIILEQLKKLGASCDWQRTRFTMEDELSKAVIKVFVDLYDKGYIYKGKRMTNWDPAALTALSDEEVIHKEEQSTLYHIQYNIVDSDDVITIATTRPETILADTAICVHPEDSRYSHLKGKKAIIPIANREVDIIFDEYVDMEFGSGGLKVTPAHDINDYELGKKHNLEVIDMLHADATLNMHGLQYEGMSREDARRQMAADLKKSGHLVKTEELVHNVGYSERSHVVVEPRLTEQWFLDMAKLSEPALKNVMNDEITFHPNNFKNTYNHWMSNIRDWCISRQLWWGQRIPAYYFGNDNEVVVAETAELALAKAQEKDSSLTMQDLRQEEDVVDTWFSSWLWPISVFDGFSDSEKAKKELDYYYPSQALVTAPDIIFFWVARMIMAGYEYMDSKPFTDVYFTGVVRDAQRRKMSKSLGNSPDPLTLIDKYSADGVRLGMLLAAPAGNDLLFDEKLCEQGRNFTNKIWNAFRLIKGWEVEEKDNSGDQAAIQWFEHKLYSSYANQEVSYSQFRISESLMTAYTLFWDDFSSWYLEFIKPVYGGTISRATLEKTLEFFEHLLKILHPFMPFITEEIYHLLKPREDGDDIIISQYSVLGKADKKVLLKGEQVQEAIRAIREVRAKAGMKNKDTIGLFINSDDPELYSTYMPSIKKLCKASDIQFTDKEHSDLTTVTVRTDQFFIDTGIELDSEEEKQRIQEELEYTRGFLVKVSKKLGNANFVTNAPEAVVANEKKKQLDAEEKIKLLEESLAKLH